MNGINLKTLRAGAIGAAFALIAATTAHAQDYRLRLAHYFPQDSYIHQAMERFAERVSEKTEGRVAIEIFGGGTLGGDRELSEQVRLGGIEMANIGVPTQAPLDKRFMAEELPYIWDSFDQLNGAYAGDFGEIIRSMMLENGARPLAFFPFGYRQMTNSVRPIREPADVDGLKIRTSDVPVRIDMLQTLGARAVPIAFTELYTALQQNVVDGQENPLFLILTSQMYEVQEFISLTRHIVNSNQIMVNEAYWQSLPADIQQIIEAESKAIADEMTTAAQDEDDKALEQLRAIEGVTIVDDVNRQAFREKLAPLYEKYREEFGDDIWNALKKYSSLPSE